MHEARSGKRWGLISDNGPSCAILFFEYAGQMYIYMDESRGLGVEG
jgi:hypothetical protein